MRCHLAKTGQRWHFFLNCSPKRQESPEMKSILLAISVLLASYTLPVWAEDAPASEASVREMLRITQAEQDYQDSMVQVQTHVLRLLEERMTTMPAKINTERLRAFQANLVATLLEESSWDKMEQDYIHLYQHTFSQTEVDGMLTFYQSDIGRALVAKTPQLTRKSMEMATERLKQALPRVEVLINAFMREEFPEQRRRVSKPRR